MKAKKEKGMGKEDKGKKSGEGKVEECARIRPRARRWDQKKTGKRKSELRPVTIVILGASLAGAPRKEGTGKAVGWTQESSNATLDPLSVKHYALPTSTLTSPQAIIMTIFLKSLVDYKHQTAQ